MDISAEHSRMQGNQFLDRSHLVRICQGDGWKAKELAAYAVPVIWKALERIQRFLDRSDDPALLSELHTLKGCVGIIEPDLVYGTVRQLEADYATLNATDKATRFEILLDEVRTLCGELERFTE
jgi:hypothetical protein